MTQSLDPILNTLLTVSLTLFLLTLRLHPPVVSYPLNRNLSFYRPLKRLLSLSPINFPPLLIPHFHKVIQSPIPYFI